MPDDALLRRYIHERSEDAFAELVRRHIDGVYSTALRRVGGDTHLAEDVTQQVFVALARKATALSCHPVLTGWLYLTTRHESANVVRREQRRKVREQEAQAMQEISSDSVSVPEWSRVAPVLDAAIDQLSEADRTAVLLRFVDRRGFAEIGTLLRVSEDAARMRHERALDKLRGLLAKRGVTSTSAALGVALANNAVAAAPAALTATVAGTVTAVSGVAASVPFFTLINLMSTTKLTFMLAGIALLAGVTVFTYKTAFASSKVETVSSSQNPPLAAVKTKSSASDRISNPTKVGLPDSPALQGPALSESSAKIAELKDILARVPAQNIPEIQLATEGDWYSAVEGALQTPEDYRRALAKLRAFAMNRFAKIAQPALQAYLKANNGQFPSEPAQLQPFLEGNPDPAMLRRYRVVPSTEISNVQMGGKTAITQITLIDSDYDTTFVIGPYGFGSTTVSPAAARDLPLLGEVQKAYRAQTSVLFAGDNIMELLPYATTAEQRAAIERAAQRAARQR